jgi:hypothetical protein
MTTKTLTNKLTMTPNNEPYNEKTIVIMDEAHQM